MPYYQLYAEYHPGAWQLICDTNEPTEVLACMRAMRTDPATYGAARKLKVDGGDVDILAWQESALAQ